MLKRSALSVEEGQALLAPFLLRERGKVAIAVSGGADSMALLWLCTKVLPAQKILALTVNHGLREEAAHEASTVGTWCKQQNIPHQTLIWVGEKPQSALQEKARKARYRLLINACLENGASCLLTGHNADDQAETVFARLGRGAGLQGLVGMPKSRKVAAEAGEAIDLIRPLLSVRRATLRETASHHKVPFFDDRSNDDPTYERVKRRAFLAATKELGLLDVDALCQTASKLMEEQKAQGIQIRESFNKAGGVFTGSGAITFDHMPFARLKNFAQKKLLARAIEAVSGEEYPLSNGKLDGQINGLIKEGKAFTQNGALVRSAKGRIVVLREPSALLGRKDGGRQPYILQNADRGAILWDRRFIIRGGKNWSQKAEIKPIGSFSKLETVDELIFATLPAVFEGEKLIAAPYYIKNMRLDGVAGWNGTISTLDMYNLTKERFNKAVLRF